MTLEQIAQQAMDYLDSVGVAADYGIYKDVKGIGNKTIDLPSVKYYEQNYIDVSFDYTYDLLEFKFLGETLTLPQLKSSTSNDFTNDFCFDSEKCKFTRDLFRIVDDRPKYRRLPTLLKSPT